MISIGNVWSVAYKAPGFTNFTRAGYHGKPLTRRRVGKLHPPAGEKGVAGDEECVGASTYKTCEGRIDFPAGAGIEDIRLQSHCASSRFDIAKGGLRSETSRTHDHGHMSNRHQIPQELQPLCA